MFDDSRRIPKGTVVEADVCIVGAGPVGITLAKEFIGQPFRVCLLESGGLKPDQKTQSLREGENAGIDYPIKQSRTRSFGGTSNVWGGWCRPLDENIFKYRSWVPDSGWPFKKAELIPYYKRSQPLCEIDSYNYDLNYWEKKFNVPDFKPLPLFDNRVVSRLYQLSRPPTHFGNVYKNDLDKAENITTYLNANVVNLETTENEKQVKRLEVNTLEGNKFSVSAKVFILATGGIENPRLLLISNKNGRTAGIGNKYDLVGRFFMEHPKVVYSGLVLTLVESSFYNNFKRYSSAYRKKILRLTIAEDVQEQEKLLSYTAFFYQSWLLSEDVKLFAKHVGRMIADLDAEYLIGEGKDSSKSQQMLFNVVSSAEQSPNPDSRVMLSSQKDKLGLNKPLLDWRLSKLDKSSMEKSLRIVGEEFGRAGLGRVQQLLVSPWKDLKISGGGHHMGTTRMHLDPKKGVVDPDCKVHDVENLFIAGSSVFPTSGSSNPQQTILALALRLADHIKKKVA